MITTRTRIFSILAVVAMMVSMLACFVIPASADAALIAPYQAVIADAASGAEALTEEIANPDATVDTLNAAATAVVLKDDIMPRYAYKAAYAAAGYTAKVYAITEAADWLAMVAASAADATLTFEGYTFNLTKDVDFNNAQMAPLCDTATAPFKGTLYGNGYAFKNINVLKNIAEPFNTVPSEIFASLSMIAYSILQPSPILQPCIMIEFLTVAFFSIFTSRNKTEFSKVPLIRQPSATRHSATEESSE